MLEANHLDFPFYCHFHFLSESDKITGSVALHLHVVKLWNCRYQKRYGTVMMSTKRDSVEDCSTVKLFVYSRHRTGIRLTSGERRRRQYGLVAVCNFAEEDS